MTFMAKINVTNCHHLFLSYKYPINSIAYIFGIRVAIANIRMSFQGIDILLWGHMQVLNKWFIAKINFINIT